MSPLTYWERRAKYRESLTNKKAADAQQKLATAYNKAASDIQSEIDKIYNRYASKGGFTLEEAKQALSVVERNEALDALRQQIAGINDPDIRRRMMSRINAPAYQYRITRLEAIQESIRVKLAAVADTELDIDTAAFTNIINDEYYRHIYDMQRGSGYGFSFSRLSTGLTDEILAQNWIGAHYSQRIWGNTARIADEVYRVFLAGLEAGRSNRAMAEEIQQRMGTGSYEAARLVHTEAAFMHGSADMVAYEEAGVEEYQFLAVIDIKTSKVCRKLDMKRFKVKDGKAGVNRPPMHPWCRSTTRAALDPEVTKDWKRRARNPITGENELVPYDMSYEEWQKKNNISAKNLNLFGGSSKIKLSKANDIRSLTKYARQTLGATKVDIRGLDPKAVKGTFKQMAKVIEQYPQLKGSIAELVKMPQSKNAIMDCGPLSSNLDKYRIRFGQSYFSDVKQLKAAAKKSVADGYWVKGAKWHSAGVHELGHVMNGLAINKSTPKGERADDWRYGFVSTVMTEKAWQSTKYLYPKSMDINSARQMISSYAKTNASETVAEAFQDAFINGKKAQPLSLMIVDYLDILTR